VATTQLKREKKKKKKTRQQETDRRRNKSNNAAKWSWSFNKKTGENRRTHRRTHATYTRQ
jgi:hypothetical protein